jgi:hypothetical protein
MSFPSSGPYSIDSDDDVAPVGEEEGQGTTTGTTAATATANRPSWYRFQHKPKENLRTQATESRSNNTAGSTTTTNHTTVIPVVPMAAMNHEATVTNNDGTMFVGEEEEVDPIGSATATTTFEDDGGGAMVPLSDTMQEYIHNNHNPLNTTNTTDIYDVTNVLDQLEQQEIDDDDDDDEAIQVDENGIPIVTRNMNQDTLRSMDTKDENGTLSNMQNEEPLMTTNNKTSTTRTGTPRFQYLRQLYVLMYYKNLSLLITRNVPFYLCMLLLSNTISVLLSWPAGRNPDSDTAIYIPVENYTSCGTLPQDLLPFVAPYINQSISNNTNDRYNQKQMLLDRIQLSYNEKFRNGLPVTVLAIGPLLFSIVVYCIVHEELSIHMLSVLRQNGVLDSTYWLSWYIPFTILAIVNSLLATGVTKLIPIHVYESVYFGGIFGSYLFLHLALMSSSMFLATVQGLRKRFVIFFLFIMILAIWMPILTMLTQSAFGITATANQDIDHTPTRLFWVYQQTETRIGSGTNRFNDDQFINSINDRNQTYDICHIPIISEQESNVYKTPTQREEVSPDQFFTGCYVSAGWGATSWSTTKKTHTGTAIWWFFPYYHFLSIWGNFCGYTAYDPRIEFQVEHMQFTAGELAREAISISSTSTDDTASLFPQGSMIQHQSYYTTQCDVGGCPDFLSNCPAYNFQNIKQYNVCETIDSMTRCPRALDPSPAEGTSVYFAFAMLFAVSITYMLMAAYWGIVFLGGAGTYPLYFFLLPSYWLGVKATKQVSAVTEYHDIDTTVVGDPHSTRTGSVDETIKIMGISKSYGNVMALQPVTFEMACGEVTALLGHNGAGTY